MLRSIFLISFVPIFVLSAIVRLEQGYINGAILKSRNGVEFHAFYGIPYAKPPVGKLRFQSPQQPAPSWKNVRNGKERPTMCLQLKIVNFTTTGIFQQNENELAGSEDCLVLNVFTPIIATTLKPLPEKKLLPVLFFIHGGGFFMGSGNMATPDYFMDKPIVLVGVNYRLGVFGFLGTGEPAATGNYGLKDQSEALKWVKKNIKTFGGNPNEITMMGQSAGAASVHLHTFSLMSKGLFQRIILHSGTALSGWAFTRKNDTKKMAKEFLQFAGCSQGSTVEQFECLREIPASKLKKLDYKFTQKRPMFISFKPTTEDESVENAFLQKDPMEHTYQITPQIPAIFGFTSIESALFAQNILRENLKLTDDLLNVILPYRLHYDSLPLPVIRNITAQVKKIYFNNSITNVNEATFCELVTDFQFKLSVIDGIRSYPGVRFVFEYDYQARTSGVKGAEHTEDMKSFFNLKFFGQPTQEEVKLSNTLITYWTNFVRTGDPNLPGMKYRPLPTEWTKTFGSTLEYLHISNNGLVVKTWNKPEKEALWEYISSFHIKPQKQFDESEYLKLTANLF